MAELIPDLNFNRIFVEPWLEHSAMTTWILLMGVLVTAACALVGNYLVVRRMALIGDAISHSILPGLVIAFLLAGSTDSWVMFTGALAAGVVTVLLIEFISHRSRVKQDAAIGITFSTLFAIGVVLLSVYSSNVHIDPDCVLYGEIGMIWLAPQTVTLAGVAIPHPIITMGGVTLATGALILLFYKELLLVAFDPGLAASLGYQPKVIHYMLMAWLSIVVVSAFESVGAILVIAMLILPGSTAFLLAHRFPAVIAWSLTHAILSSFFGLHLGIWLNASIAGSMVLVGGGLFGLAWLLSPSQGIIPRMIRHREIYSEPNADSSPVEVHS